MITSEYKKEQTEQNLDIFFLLFKGQEHEIIAG